MRRAQGAQDSPPLCEAASLAALVPQGGEACCHELSWPWTQSTPQPKAVGLPAGRVRGATAVLETATRNAINRESQGSRKIDLLNFEIVV